jgi:hypothetical protein
MITLYKSKNIDNYVLFDIILAIAFPLLIYISIGTVVPLSIFIFLTVTHIIMAILRYCCGGHIRKITNPNLPYYYGHENDQLENPKSLENPKVLGSLNF